MAEYEVTVTRSNGADGAVLVLIDGPFDEGGGLRILVNDETVYADPAYTHDEEEDHPAASVGLVIRDEDIAYEEADHG